MLDPACGSGAFLIEAFDQLHAAFEASNDRLVELRGHQTLFDLDRQILQNNLYGVDLNEEAVEICRLSLWIKTAARGKMLTALDHTIRVGNSVVDDCQVHAKAFDWRAAFPEVFAPRSLGEGQAMKASGSPRPYPGEGQGVRAVGGGFDVIVANPPYIRQEWLAPYKAYWQRRFKSYSGTADIFAYFYELGVELLRDGGRLGFITSGSWVRGNYGGPLRKYLAENAKVDSMIDFGEFQPFEGAEMIRPTIAVLTKQPPGGPMRLFKWLTGGSPPENLSDVIANALTMRTDHLGEETWELEQDDVIALRKRMMACGSSLSKYTRGKFLRGVVTGANDVFVINTKLRDELISKDAASAEIIKPLIQGSQIRAWHIEQTDEHLIFTRRGIEIERYPAILEHLSQYRERLEPKPEGWTGSRGQKWTGRKPGIYKWYEIQDAIDYWQEFEQEKILWPDIAKLPRFTLDRQRHYLTNTGYVIPIADYYLLGILSSWATWFIISKTAQPLRLRGDRWQYRLFGQFMENLPIPSAGNEERDAVAELSRRCSVVGQDCYDLQENFRRRVRSTFGQDSDGAAAGRLEPESGSVVGIDLAAAWGSAEDEFQAVRRPAEESADGRPVGTVPCGEAGHRSSPDP